MNCISDSETSDSELSDSETSSYKLNNEFTNKINVEKYNLHFDLHKSMFLKELCELFNYKFEVNKGKLMIYSINDSLKKELIDRDKIIYFLQIELINSFLKKGYNLYYNNGKNLYNSLLYFKDIKTIYEALENIKICLKYKPIKEINSNLKILKPTVL